MHSGETVENEAGTWLLTVLVAEDDSLTQELCSARLRAGHYRVIEAPNGDRALPLLRGGGIDVLVTDICMPGMLDGWSLAEQARLVNPHIAVVYTSSRRPDRARQVHDSMYIEKPYRTDAIIAAIRQLTVR